MMINHIDILVAAAPSKFLGQSEGCCTGGGGKGIYRQPLSIYIERKSEKMGTSESKSYRCYSISATDLCRLDLTFANRDHDRMSSRSTKLMIFINVFSMLKGPLLGVASGIYLHKLIHFRFRT